MQASGMHQDTASSMLGLNVVKRKELSRDPVRRRHLLTGIQNAAHDSSYLPHLRPPKHLCQGQQRQEVPLQQDVVAISQPFQRGTGHRW